MTIMYSHGSVGQEWNQKHILVSQLPLFGSRKSHIVETRTPNFLGTKSFRFWVPENPPTAQSTEIWDCPKSEFQAHPSSTDIWISFFIQILLMSSIIERIEEN